MTKPIPGCEHSKERMVEWVDSGACPICLTATLGMTTDRLNDALAKVAELRETLKRAVPLIVRSPETHEPLLSDCKRVLRSDQGKE